MTRPARHQLLVVVFVVAAFFAAPRMADWVSWGLAATLGPLIALAFWVTAPLHRARSLLGQRDFERAASEAAAFARSLAASPWKRRLAGLAVGFHSMNALAVARNTLGAVRLDQGQLEEAERQFKKALEQDPGYGVPWGNLAVLAAMRGDAEGAEAARAKAATLGFKPKRLAAVIADKLARR